MKIQIDTKEKTIKIEESVNLGEMCKVLDKLLPKEWKTYSLVSGSILYWTSPTIWYYHDPIPFTPTITLPNPYAISCGGTTSCYNIEAVIN